MDARSLFNMLFIRTIMTRIAPTSSLSTTNIPKSTIVSLEIYSGIKMHPTSFVKTNYGVTIVETCIGTSTSSIRNFFPIFIYSNMQSTVIRT